MRITWRPGYRDLYALLGVGIIVYEMFHEARLEMLGVAMGLLGYRVAAGPLKIGGLFGEVPKAKRTDGRDSEGSSTGPQ